MATIDLRKFSVPNSGHASFRDNHLCYNDGSAWNWHLMKFDIPDFLMKKIEVDVSFSFCGSGSKSFYINQWGGADLAVVGRCGTFSKMDADFLKVEFGDVIRVNLIYRCSHPSLLIGTYDTKGYYQGENEDQFEIHSVKVSTVDNDARSVTQTLTVVDVGARGGLQDNWKPFSGLINAYLFEPDQVEAKQLREMEVPNVHIIEKALFNVDGKFPLYCARMPGCSSLKFPRYDFLSQFSVGPAFDILSVEMMNCTRYDSLFAVGVVGRAEFVKIDVQGCEYEVLEGFGDLLDYVLGIELEAHFYEVYKNQKLLADIIQMLKKRGLYLRNLVPQFSFDKLYVEVNAYFTRLYPQNDIDIEKIRVIESAYSLKHYSDGEKLTLSIGSAMLHKPRLEHPQEC